MYSLFERFQGGLLGLTIGQALVSHLPDSGLDRDWTVIPQVMKGHVSAPELLGSLSSGTFSPIDWTLYGTLSLAITGDFAPKLQDYESWSQVKIPLHKEVLAWVDRSIQSRRSLVAVVRDLQAQGLTPREQSIAWAIYGAMSSPGVWELAIDRILQVTPLPDCTIPLLGCLLGIQGGSRGIPAALREKIVDGGAIDLQAKQLVRDWSGCGNWESRGAIVVSPRRVQLH